MKLAVIIPTFSNLEGANNLVKQVCEKFYTILIDDSGEKKFFGSFLHLIHHKENKGIAPSWNDGIRAAIENDCTHFAIFNDDIELCEGWWEVCKAEFDKGAHMVCLDQPSPIPLTGWFFILDKECIDKVGMFDEQFVPFCAEDHDYWIRFQQSGLKMSKVSLDIKHESSATVGKLETAYYRQVRQENWQRLRNKYPNMRMTAQNF